MERWLQRVSRSEFKGRINANASFKGVPFILENSKVTFGRRLVPHEYPLKDTPFTEDLGRRVRIFNIQGSILGEDFLSDRDSLISACEAQGVGEFINPWIGNLRVLCQEIKFEDNISSVRNTRFEAVFIEVGEFTFPQSSPDTTGAVESATALTVQSLRNVFEIIYDITTQPLVFTSEALESLKTAYRAIERARRLTSGSDFLRELKSIQNKATGIVTSGVEVFDSIVKLITFGIFDDENFDEGINQRNSFEGLSELLDFKSVENPNSTNSESIDLLVQQITVVTMALNTSKIEFDSANEAREFRNTILFKLDDLILKSITTEETLQFNELRSVVVKDIDTRSIVLPELKTIIPNKTIPSIVLSQNLYATKERADDIVTRNNIEHPGFIPGGEGLEVLIDV